jgi:hypothetical protein
MNRKRTTQKKVIMIELSKPLVIRTLYFSLTMTQATHDILIKRQRRGHKAALLKRHFYYRDYQEKPAIPPPQYNNRPSLKPDTIEKSKRILGRHFDVYALKSEWLGWFTFPLL